MNIKENWLKLRNHLDYTEWTPMQLYWFRFYVILLIWGKYLLLKRVFLLEPIIGFEPTGETASSLVIWFGKWALGFDLSNAMADSSTDSVYAWSHDATCLTFSLVLAFIWGKVDHRRAYPLLKDAIWTLTRVIVAFHMFAYAFPKIFDI